MHRQPVLGPIQRVLVSEGGINPTLMNTRQRLRTVPADLEALAHAAVRLKQVRRSGAPAVAAKVKRKRARSVADGKRGWGHRCGLESEAQHPPDAASSRSLQQGRAVRSAVDQLHGQVSVSIARDGNKPIPR